VGRLKQDRWNGADGKPHSKIAIVAEHVEFRPDFRQESPRHGENAEGLGESYAEAAMAEEEFSPAMTEARGEAGF
jgi:single-strand DNA-binding protein